MHEYAGIKIYGTKSQIETAEKSLFKRYRVLPAVPDFLKDPSYSFSLFYQVTFTPFFTEVLPPFRPVFTV